MQCKGLIYNETELQWFSVDTAMQDQVFEMKFKYLIYWCLYLVLLV